MPRHVVLLRGINIGPNKRIAMPALREALSEAGFEEVQTYVQSGNVVLSSGDSAKKVADRCETLIAEKFGFEVPVIVRTGDELAEVVRRDPFKDVVDEPKRYQVTFLAREADPAVVERLTALVAPPEQLEASGRELYTWHPNGIGRSKLAAALANSNLGITATARNWRTVTTLLEMAQD
jgi:uncharacterized protein (DUF1697 family)